MKEKLLQEALEVKTLYNCGKISRDEAKEKIKPYAEYFNNRSKELASKYNVKPTKFSFTSFMR